MGNKAVKRKNGKSAMGYGSKIVLMICLIVFCASAACLADYFHKNYFKVQKEAKQLAEKSKDRKGLLELYEENNDLIGWIKVDNTKIDYPVMQTKSQPEYYLRKDFEKNYSLAGTPFIDAGSDIEEPTFNWLIYGHNMKSGVMFHDLLKYEEKEFMESNPAFTLSVIKKTEEGLSVEKDKYRIVAACYSEVRSEDDKAFKYYKYSSYTDEKMFEEFVKGIKNESCYDTGITPAYGDQLVTLSTCAYHTENGRFYVVGVKQN
ncbi:MAG: class B sortase [Firmicutes bacterium]|nr:class B sortase [Bacillota bacterium]